jgi:hypothetical protein
MIFVETIPGLRGGGNKNREWRGGEFKYDILDTL